MNSAVSLFQCSDSHPIYIDHIRYIAYIYFHSLFYEGVHFISNSEQMFKVFIKTNYPNNLKQDIEWFNLFNAIPIFMEYLWNKYNRTTCIGKP